MPLNLTNYHEWLALDVGAFSLVLGAGVCGERFFTTKSRRHKGLSPESWGGGYVEGRKLGREEDKMFAFG